MDAVERKKYGICLSFSDSACALIKKYYDTFENMNDHKVQDASTETLSLLSNKEEKPFPEKVSSAVWEWCAPGVVDFKEWRTSNIPDINEVFYSALDELIKNSNLYVIWRDRKVYIFVRDILTKEVRKAKQIDYTPDKKFILFTV